MWMKILHYEMKRIWLGRLFPILLICNGIYAYLWMNQTGIGGIGGTAPFSLWTYMAFCGSMLPPAALTMLLMQAKYYSLKQQKDDILPLASPCSAEMLLFLRQLALLCCFAAIFLLDSAVFLYPCIRYFKQTAALANLLPGLLLMLPCIILALALGTLVGRLHGKLIYLLATILLAAGLFQTDSPFDLFCGSYFSERPLALPIGPDGEVAFCIETVWLVMRFLYLAAAIALTAFCLYRQPKPKRTEAAI